MIKKWIACRQVEELIKDAQSDLELILKMTGSNYRSQEKVFRR